jgi:hypothetical protein
LGEFDRGNCRTLFNIGAQHLLMPFGEEHPLQNSIPLE